MSVKFPGIAGLGIMGRSLTDRLISKGYRVGVYNRSKEKALEMENKGALVFASPGELAKNCHPVLTFLTDSTAVENVVSGDSGILENLPAQSVHCEMSTVLPADAKKLAERYASRGKKFLQSPVLGSKAQILDGSLLIFAGGSEENIAECSSVFQDFSSKVWKFASPMEAALIKLTCNMLIAHTIVGLGQAFVFLKKNGLAPSVFLDILSRSALNSPMIQAKGKSILEENVSPNFHLKNMLKDLKLLEKTGDDLGVELFTAGMERELFERADAMGFGSDDYAAVIRAMEKIANV